MAVKYGPYLLTLKKGSRLLKSSSWGNFSAFTTWSTRPTTGRGKINFLVGPQASLLATVMRWKLAWFGHVTHHNRPFQNHPSGHFGGGRRRCQQRKCWMDNIKERTSLPMQELLTKASCRKEWNRISAESSAVFPDDLIGQGAKLTWTVALWNVVSQFLKDQAHINQQCYVLIYS